MGDAARSLPGCPRRRRAGCAEAEGRFGDSSRVCGERRGPGSQSLRPRDSGICSRDFLGLACLLGGRGKMTALRAQQSSG